MTGPDFSELGGEETNSSSSNSGSSSRTSFKQIHVQGRYGTTTIKNTEGCQVCGRNSEKLLLVGYSKMLNKGTWDREIQTCESHVGDVLGDLEVPREEIEIKEF